MPKTMIVAASNWNRTKRVNCTVVVRADNVVRNHVARKPQLFDLPDNTTSVEITVTPIAPALHWPRTISLSVDSTGVFSPAQASLPFTVVQRNPPPKPATLVICKLSRFRDVSSEFNDLLKTPPVTRFLPKSAEFNRPADVLQPDDEQASLVAQYGGWPPGSWAVPPLDSATYLEAATGAAGNALTFSPVPSVPAQRTTVDPKVETVILELQGATSPRIFGVTWPADISRKVRQPDDPKVSFLLYLRQTSGQNVIADGMFEGRDIPGRYPRNFDYAERCLFESMHYGRTPLQSVVSGVVLGFALRPKGAPYQIAKSGVPVVAVYPVAQAYKEFRDLVPTDKIEGILEEIQAFMFWKAGTVDPPPEIGKTAISAFSSSNYTLQAWLEQPVNRNGHFLAKKVTALYLFDPPDPEGMTKWALVWATVPGSKKRMRFYGRGMDKVHPEISSIHESLLGANLAALKNGAAHPPVPFIELSPAGHTIALLPFVSWQQTFRNLHMPDVVGIWNAHHLIPATMLTHALRQGDV